MIFGEVPLSEAEGAILAHSVALRKGRLRKGVTLSAEDIAALRAAGVEAVTVARLDPTDIDENAAAAALAQALVGETGLRLSKAATGRVNVIATGPGLARLDVAALHRVNAVDHAVTVATVPDWHRMEPGGLIATIKIITYAVPRTALDTACAGGAGAIGFLAPTRGSVALIETVVGAEPPDKGERALQERVARLGVTFAGARRVPHRIGPLIEAIKGSAADVICILTASATSDRRDVAPAALKAAGGRLIRYGMPVDPGNLLFLGAIGERPVIGLPGCARSSALNGADWVLDRVLCGHLPTDAEIAAMGVGGLLKEIPQRPSPRRKHG